jgi:hypothetical protein
MTSKARRVDVADRWRRTRRVVYVGALAAVVFASSFLLTLWYIDTRPPLDIHPPIEQLREKQISNYPELYRVADAMGLKRSPQMKGNVDGIKRINEQEVSIGGWLADIEGDATPLNIIVYVGGRVAAIGQTKGARADVTHALGLAFGAEKNIVFQVSFTCRTGDLPVVVGLSPNRHYLPLKSHPCP